MEEVRLFDIAMVAIAACGLIILVLMVLLEKPETKELDDRIEPNLGDIDNVDIGPTGPVIDPIPSKEV